MYYVEEGLAVQGNAKSKFKGPVSKDYLAQDNLLVIANLGCEAKVVPLNVDSQVRIEGALTAQGQITTDSIDLKIQTILRIRTDLLKKCD